MCDVTNNDAVLAAVDGATAVGFPVHCHVPCYPWSHVPCYPWPHVSVAHPALYPSVRTLPPLLTGQAHGRPVEMLVCSAGLAEPGTTQACLCPKPSPCHTVPSPAMPCLARVVTARILCRYWSRPASPADGSQLLWLALCRQGGLPADPADAYLIESFDSLTRTLIFATRIAQTRPILLSGLTDNDRLSCRACWPTSSLATLFL